MTQATIPLDSNLFQKDLLQWYYTYGRDLPWRHSPKHPKVVSAYQTVVSEFMLQQTQVSTALPYFERWCEAFPDFHTLAQAPEDQVLKLWEGLGYYSRARHLHAVSKLIAALPKVPETAKEWQRFPGVGAYTAAAISSIAFQDPVAVADGNVVRITARLFAHEQPFLTHTQSLKFAQNAADQLLNKEHAGDHNQAMMELGATICLPKNPNCTECPVQSHCMAKAKGLQDELPKLPKRMITESTVHRAWVFEQGQLLLHRIPAHSKRLGSMFELPLFADVHTDNPTSRIPHWQKKRAIANERISEWIYKLSPKDLKEAYDKERDFHWIGLQDLDRLTLSGPHRRWIESILAEVLR
jgi:A/G-specific adenine glycosylase